MELSSRDDNDDALASIGELTFPRFSFFQVPILSLHPSLPLSLFSPSFSLTFLPPCLFVSLTLDESFSGIHLWFFQLYPAKREYCVRRRAHDRVRA